MSASFRRQLLEDIAQGNVERVAHVVATTPSEFKAKHIAAALVQPKVLEVLLPLCESRIKYSDVDVSQWFYQLIEDENSESLALLMKSGVFLEKTGRSPAAEFMAIAVEQEAFKMAHVFLDNYTDFHHCPKNMNRAFVAALLQNQSSLCSKMIDKGADWTCGISIVIEQGNHELFEDFLSHWSDAEINDIGNQGRLGKWLSDAACNVQTKMAERLLNRIIDPIARAQDVYNACINGLSLTPQLETIRYLVGHLSDTTPNQEVACALLTCPFDNALFEEVLARVKYEEGPYHLMLDEACQEGNVAACKRLLEDYSPSSEELENMLTSAALKNHAEVIDALVASRDWNEAIECIQNAEFIVKPVMDSKGQVSYLSSLLERQTLMEHVSSFSNPISKKKM